MIGAKELRIGNCFMAGKSPAVVLEIMASGVSFDSINGDICVSHCDWDYVSFIPLTEQWLIDFGFEKDECFEMYYEFENDGVKIISDGREDTFMVDNITGKAVYLKHVHQLQNLYFALTGEDLHL